MKTLFNKITKKIILPLFLTMGSLKGVGQTISLVPKDSNRTNSMFEYVIASRIGFKDETTHEPKYDSLKLFLKDENKDKTLDEITLVYFNKKERMTVSLKDLNYDRCFEYNLYTSIITINIAPYREVGHGGIPFPDFLQEIKNWPEGECTIYNNKQKFTLNDLK